MRLHACAATLIPALAVAGCTSAGDGPEWSRPPDPSNIAASIKNFNAYAAGVDERWERSAAMAAAEFLRLDQRAAVATTIEGKASAEGTRPQTVVVRLDGLLDDSVRAERWTLAFEENAGFYALTSAIREQRCQPGRGHQAFSADVCV